LQWATDKRGIAFRSAAKSFRLKGLQNLNNSNYLGFVHRPEIKYIEEVKGSYCEKQAFLFCDNLCRHTSRILNFPQGLIGFKLKNQSHDDMALL